MHIGPGTTASKTGAMYYPTSTGSYEDSDTTPFTVSGPGGEDPGFVSFTKELKYLGSIVQSSLAPDAGAGERIRSAVAAFRALRSVPCNPALEDAPRSKVY